jgi:adenine-specific DNA-methyltransferase
MTGARFPYYVLADSREGQMKEAELSQLPPSNAQTHQSVRHGFVYQRRPRITSSVIANNAQIDVIYSEYINKLKEALVEFNNVSGLNFSESSIPSEENPSWKDAAKLAYQKFMAEKTEMRRLMAESSRAKADFVYLFDQPCEDRKKVRVAGPFTVESLTPHRTLVVNEEGDAVDLTESRLGFTAKKNFTELILENLKAAGVQQAHKEDKIMLSSLSPWPGDLICAEGRYREGDVERRAAIFIGPEFGTVQRPDLVQAAREASDAKFDVLITCAFNYDGHSTDFAKLGSLPVLKARMNADLHMAENLKNTGKGNLFVIFGEPDIDLITDPDGQIRVKVNGVDVFKPQLGTVVSSNTDEIACWFIDTDYNEESFFVRHAYFLGANDPYDSLKSTLKTEIDKEAWDSLNSDTSRPFPKPKSKRIAVKVINHLGDEVMRIFKVE